jgi:hypothetical protein
MARGLFAGRAPVFFEKSNAGLHFNRDKRSS